MRKFLCLLLCLLMLIPAFARTQADPLPMAEVIFWPGEKADAAIILTQGSTVLIDTGSDKMGRQMADFLIRRGIESIDLMIVTHFDKDHVGGADKLLKALPVAMVIEPSYQKESKQYTQYRQALEASPQARLETLRGNVSFELDGLHYEIDVANADDYGEGEENDFSLVTRLNIGALRLLFAGDAEAPRLAELIAEGDLASDVLKVPHHGRANRLSAAFFEAVSPRYAVITSDEKEKEDTAVIEALRAIGTEVYLTREGMVTILTDGESLSVRQEEP